MGHPNGENWKAWHEDAPIGGGAVTLVLTGLVRVEENDKPDIEEYQPANIAPKTLGLSLSNAQDGTHWKRVWFEKHVQAGQYTDIQLYWDTNTASGGKVQIDKK